jgi:aminoglycoside phosphotransferase (APT) family kinase protein
MPDTIAGIDAPALDRWFADHVAGAEPPLRFEVIAGGHSNITYRVLDAGGRAFVLRRPPLGHVLATAHDMGREFRIISALGPTAVPVAPALGLCTDESVNGAPFYVMAFVEGHVLATADDVDAAVPDAAARRTIGDHVADILADLHGVDVDAVGLGDLGRREGYVDRQLRRWRGQWEQSKTRELPAMDEAFALLSERKPPQRYTGIVHGDYRIGNFIARPEGRIAAVLDWELCTLGDVLADVGYLLNNWVGPDEPLDGLVDPPPTAAGGFPSRDDFVARYAARTGFDVSQIDYYRAFSFWRSAAIVEGVKRRYIEGVMVDETFPVDLYDQRVADLADLALERARSLVGR